MTQHLLKKYTGAQAPDNRYTPFSRALSPEVSEPACRQAGITLKYILASERRAGAKRRRESRCSLCKNIIMEDRDDLDSFSEGKWYTKKARSI